MGVTVKTAGEIALMRESCRRLEFVFDELEKIIRPGITTWEINRVGERLIREQGGIPNFLNYEGYPASICTSVNDEVVHGIPSKGTVLEEGDIISLDAGMILEGYHSDAARTYTVGKVSDEARQLIEVTKECFFRGADKARAGNHICDISNAVAEYAEKFGYGIVRDLVGHGIGRELHEDPQIPNFRTKRRGTKLVPGMTLAIEPMITAGGWEVLFLDDDWTVVTADGSLAAHYENTVLVTDGEPEILTLTKGRS